ncbi:MAG TPA: nucleotide exchange factor GrpE [Clostridiaceae bacterium]|nr:nucleotide exchange factor GrpE [Clostridiaceae bacterium]
MEDKKLTDKNAKEKDRLSTEAENLKQEECSYEHSPECSPESSTECSPENSSECSSEGEENDSSKGVENSLENENQKLINEIETLKKKLQEAEAKCDEYLDMLKRVAAEYDNYKKRTQREKEQLSKDVTCEVVAAFIPVADNLERALDAAEKDGGSKVIKEGIEMVYRQFKDILKRLDVTEIESMGKKFDPNLHNAVMHVKDERYGENEIIEVFQKGYILKDKVIRHSMVKVAN